MNVWDLKVYGRVQGVYLRMTIKKYCSDNEIEGFVSNLDDGSVFVKIYCSDKKLKDFVTWLEKSPGLSKVNKIEFSKVKGNVNKGFKILKQRSFINDQIKSFSNLGEALLRK